jgi:hypothetical protein
MLNSATGTQDSLHKLVSSLELHLVLVALLSQEPPTLLLGLLALDNSSGQPRTKAHTPPTPRSNSLIGKARIRSYGCHPENPTSNIFPTLLGYYGQQPVDGQQPQQQTS